MMTVAGLSDLRARRKRFRIPPLPTGFIVAFAAAMCLFVIQPWSFSIGEIPLQVMLAWIAFGWVLTFHKQMLLYLPRVFSGVQWFAIAVLCVSIFLRSYIDGDLLRFVQFITGLWIGLVGAVVFISKRGRNIVLSCVAAMAALSGFVALAQSAGLLAWTFERTLYAGRVGTPSGLESFPVAFSYGVVAIGTIVIAHVILSWRNKIRLLSMPPFLALLCAVLILGGLVATKSRSGVLGVALGTAVIIFGIYYVRLRFVPRPFLLLILGAAVLYGFQAKSAGSPVPLMDDIRFTVNWQTYVPAMEHFILGRPNGMEDIDYYERLSVLEGTPQYQELLEQVQQIAPHNIVLTTGITYGPASALALVILYVSALVSGARKVLRSTSSEQQFSRLWVLVLVAANVAVITHSWFHNANLAMGEMRNWIWLGGLCAVTRWGLTTPQLPNKARSTFMSLAKRGNIGIAA